MAAHCLPIGCRRPRPNALPWRPAAAGRGRAFPEGAGCDPLARAAGAGAGASSSRQGAVGAHGSAGRARRRQPGRGLRAAETPGKCPRNSVLERDLKLPSSSRPLRSQLGLKPELFVNVPPCSHPCSFFNQRRRDALQKTFLKNTFIFSPLRTHTLLAAECTIHSCNWFYSFVPCLKVLCIYQTINQVAFTCDWKICPYRTVLIDGAGKEARTLPWRVTARCGGWANEFQTDVYCPPHPVRVARKNTAHVCWVTHKKLPNVCYDAGLHFPVQYPGTS